jgi:hypothetical protein
MDRKIKIEQKFSLKFEKTKKKIGKYFQSFIKRDVMQSQYRFNKDSTSLLL